MADPHRGGTCADGEYRGFTRVTDVDPGVQEVLCPCGSWVTQTVDGRAIAYSDHPDPTYTCDVCGDTAISLVDGAWCIACVPEARRKQWRLKDFLYKEQRR